MHLSSLLPIVGACGALVVTGGALATIWVVAKSKLPESTILIQDSNIKALQEQNTIIQKQLEDAINLISDLKSRVELLETLPLGNIRDDLKGIRILAEANSQKLDAVLSAPTQPSQTINLNK